LHPIFPASRSESLTSVCCYDDDDDDDDCQGISPWPSPDRHPATLLAYRSKGGSGDQSTMEAGICWDFGPVDDALLFLFKGSWKRGCFLDFGFCHFLPEFGFCIGYTRLY